MFTVYRFIVSLSLLVIASFGLVACSDDLPCPEIVQVARQPLGADGDLCKQAADCMPTHKPCAATACVDNTCKTVPLDKGDPCSNGVGLCDGALECQEVKGVCKEWNGPMVTPCDADSECDDGTPCTVDKCHAGWCAHAALDDGSKCGSDLSCKQGLCCVAD